MDGLPTRRDFALGLVAAGTVLPASRWAIGFPPAEANTRAERNAPIAPVVPKAFEEFGGVRIDNYDWLRDRKDPRVLAYLEAENTYADARLTTIKPLVDDLAAELKVRSAQEDASVPAADNGYLYERRFAQGAQYPLTKATARRIQRIRRQ
jgi:oligopeptidase B